ncbi:MAG: antibiotic biosynthesis monooxygenase [Oculatellaceae cyanobacterium bins.114]|nr:antibiotic biosynthesis monooxygenase [Oculatellaceae cyanobacterium bins.114]
MTALIDPNVATFINVFTVEPSKQNTLVHRIKSDAETLISRQAGFIKATIHRSLDSSRVVNVVQWESVEASREIHHNPEIAAGFASYQELNVQMDLRYYETALTTRQHPLSLSDDSLVAQIDVLHVAPENQQFLLEQLTHRSTSAIASQTADDSTTILRSLDGSRVIRFHDLHQSNDVGNTTPNSHQIIATQNLIEQVDSNCYQVECIVAK